MVELTKSVLSFSLAQSLFGAHQLLNTFTGLRSGWPSKAIESFESLTGVAERQLKDPFQGIYYVGDLAQRGLMDGAWNVLTGRGLNLRAALEQTVGITGQLWSALRSLGAGEDLRLALQEFSDKLRVFYWVRNVESLLHLPANGSYVPLLELVDRSYALGDFQALWAVEGAGHYYALSRWPRGAEPRDLLTDSLAANVPDKSLTMLHAGLGLALADRVLEEIAPAPSRQAVRNAVSRFIALCRENSQPGYIGAALESFGLDVRITYPQLVPAIDRELAERDVEALAYFWHGVGRAIYFSPTYFLPFGRSPWRSVEMCCGEAPHELGRLNAIAGLSWATSLVNMLRPQVLEAVVRRHGEEFLQDEAFANGIGSAFIVRLDMTPRAPFLDSFCRFQPFDMGPIRALWQRLVRQPCQEAKECYPALKQASRLGEVFRYRQWDGMSAQPTPAVSPDQAGRRQALESPKRRGDYLNRGRKDRRGAKDVAVSKPGGEGSG